jgi:thiamine biosynthesis lipoprotein
MKSRNIFIQLILLVFFFLVAFLISHSAKKGKYNTLTGFTQGTTYRITYNSKNKANYQADIDSIFSRVNNSLSIYQPNSVISRFNRNVSGTVADELFTEIFNKSFEVYTATGGAFDITVGPIVNALGFGSGDTLNIDSTLIDSLHQFIGMKKVRLENDRLIKTDSNIVLDVNAIAQGYTVDLVAQYLRNNGVKNFMVEIGGEIRAQGKNESNRIWQIGIDKPVEGNNLPGANLQAIIALDNRSLATSGNYRKFYEKNGIKYVHTIDPLTGYPVTSSLLSASVVADDCTTSDAYATAFMVFGLEKSIAFLKGNSFLDAYLIYADSIGNFRVFVTPGLGKYIRE